MNLEDTRWRKDPASLFPRCAGSSVWVDRVRVQRQVIAYQAAAAGGGKRRGPAFSAGHRLLRWPPEYAFVRLRRGTPSLTAAPCTVYNQLVPVDAEFGPFLCLDPSAGDGSPGGLAGLVETVLAATEGVVHAVFSARCDFASVRLVWHGGGAPPRARNPAPPEQVSGKAKCQTVGDHRKASCLPSSLEPSTHNSGEEVSCSANCQTVGDGVSRLPSLPKPSTNGSGPPEHRCGRYFCWDPSAVRGVAGGGLVFVHWSMAWAGGRVVPAALPHWDAVVYAVLARLEAAGDAAAFAALAAGHWERFSTAARPGDVAKAVPVACAAAGEAPYFRELGVRRCSQFHCGNRTSNPEQANPASEPEGGGCGLLENQNSSGDPEVLGGAQTYGERSGQLGMASAAAPYERELGVCCAKGKGAAELDEAQTHGQRSGQASAAPEELGGAQTHRQRSGQLSMASAAPYGREVGGAPAELGGAQTYGERSGQLSVASAAPDDRELVVRYAKGNGTPAELDEAQTYGVRCGQFRLAAAPYGGVIGGCTKVNRAPAELDDHGERTVRSSDLDKPLRPATAPPLARGVASAELDASKTHRLTVSSARLIALCPAARVGRPGLAGGPSAASTLRPDLAGGTSYSPPAPVAWGSSGSFASAASIYERSGVLRRLESSGLRLALAPERHPLHAFDPAPVAEKWGDRAFDRDHAALAYHAPRCASSAAVNRLRGACPHAAAVPEEGGQAESPGGGRAREGPAGGLLDRSVQAQLTQHPADRGVQLNALDDPPAARCGKVDHPGQVCPRDGGANPTGQVPPAAALAASRCGEVEQAEPPGGGRACEGPAGGPLDLSVQVQLAQHPAERGVLFNALDGPQAAFCGEVEQAEPPVGGRAREYPAGGPLDRIVRVPLARHLADRGVLLNALDDARAGRVPQAMKSLASFREKQDNAAAAARKGKLKKKKKAGRDKGAPPAGRQRLSPRAGRRLCRRLVRDTLLEIRREEESLLMSGEDALAAARRGREPHPESQRPPAPAPAQRQDRPDRVAEGVGDGDRVRDRGHCEGTAVRRSEESARSEQKQYVTSLRAKLEREETRLVCCRIAATVPRRASSVNKTTPGRHEGALTPVC
ncbi:hypothetical protein DIPPA_07988 [Diplonema papillatum]|nr:hypothetical protein DIPPA_07988 [Diplonema papillatum]